MHKFYYVTVATGKDFINTYTKYAIRSLIKAGMSPSDIHVVGNGKDDVNLLRNKVPDVNIYKIKEDLSHVTWTVFSGKRKYSLFKAAALYKVFTKPVPGQCMIYFDGDVLFYKNPTSFFETKCDKTWFHHGKDLAKRASISKDKVDITSFDSLQKWISAPCAHLMVKHGAKRIPDREVVAGFYLLHPRDHEQVLRLTYEYCIENADKFAKHEGAGDQKPMNAALSVANIDWHGGSRFLCPEHKDYFDHFFGKKNMKDEFRRKAKQIGL